MGCGVDNLWNEWQMKNARSQMNQKGKSLSFVEDSLQSFMKERYDNTKEDISLEEIIFF